MGYSILLVDDSTVVKVVLLKILSSSQLPIERVLEASNGVEALRLIANEPVDLVITDINMPQMDGFELIERMRLDMMMKDIPVMVISTEGSLTRVSHLEGLGVKGYIRKPFTAQEITQAIAEILGGEA
ncbi:MAG TPA: response regulator [Deltaproteobacteria bacterium]|nr:response regulator [Deltaproteobacteria bacterium]